MAHVPSTSLLRKLKDLRTIDQAAITPFKSEITFTVDIELFISWDMGLIQLRGWPVMNKPINTLH